MKFPKTLSITKLVCYFGVLVSLVLGVTSTQEAHSQSSIQSHAWNSAGTFEPISRTAVRITGRITISDDTRFAVNGQETELVFENGNRTLLSSLGASWRRWGTINDRKVTAEVFQMSDDPSPLLNGNDLCGLVSPDENLFVVFHQSYSFGSPILNSAIFKSNEAPRDIGSPGLCGTFSYSR